MNVPNVAKTSLERHPCDHGDAGFFARCAKYSENDELILSGWYQERASGASDAKTDGLISREYPSQTGIVSGVLMPYS